MSSDSVAIFPFSKKNFLIRLNDPQQFAKWDKILSKMGASRNNSSEDPGWLLPKNKSEEFEEAVVQYGSRQRSKRSRGRKAVRDDDSDREHSPQRKGSRFRTKRAEESSKEERKEPKHSPDKASLDENRRHSRDSDEEEESESSDDEMIQTVLARRIKSESSHKSIIEEGIDDSNDEDCVSYSRRLRHIYAVLKEQRGRIDALEAMLAKRSLSDT